jgi:hypothetical protein
MVSLLLVAFATGSLFLLSFIFFLDPFHRNSKANFCLALFFVCYGCALLSKLVLMAFGSELLEELVLLIEATRFAMAPVLYFAICFFVNINYRLSAYHALHFLPVLLFLFVVIGMYGPGRSFPLENSFFSYLPIVFSAGVKFQMIIYWVLSLYLLKRHEEHVKRFTASPEDIDLRWLRYFLYGLGIILIVWLNSVIFKNESLAGATDLLTLILIYFIGYCAFNQKQIFPANASEKESLQIVLADSPQNSPRTARVSESDMIILKSQLIHKMEKEKLYLNHELDLSKLSSALALSPHDLSYPHFQSFSRNFISQ